MASSPEPPAPTRVVFVSDVHLRYEDEPYLGQFVDFLRGFARDASHLFVHGDLFDFYVGPRQGQLAFYRPLFAALEEVVREGTQLCVLHGNRDYLLGKCFRRAGARVVPDEVVLDLGGEAVHLSHGDQFCVEDRSYLFWARGVLRAWPVRLLMRSLPSFVGVRLARAYRRISGRKVARMAERHLAGAEDAAHEERGRLPTILEGVRQMLARRAFDVVICGHIHHLAETPMEGPLGSSRLLTTGAWEEGPNCVEWRPETGFRLIVREGEGKEASWRPYATADPGEEPLGRSSAEIS